MAMSAQEKFEYWLDIAQSDLRVAGVMLNNALWLYMAFMCQQAVEKLVKGLYLLYLDDDVPRTHNIRHLIGRYEQKLPVEVPPETRKLFADLSSYYVNNRYPDFKKALASQFDEAKATELYSQTKEVFAWLLTMKP